jgi:hypothetical protein
LFAKGGLKNIALNTNCFDKYCHSITAIQINKVELGLQACDARTVEHFRARKRRVKRCGKQRTKKTAIKVAVRDRIYIKL